MLHVSYLQFHCDFRWLQLVFAWHSLSRGRREDYIYTVLDLVAKSVSVSLAICLHSKLNLSIFSDDV